MRMPALTSAVRTAGGDLADRSRLILAAKTAIAAALAWYLAPWVPFADADYSYYAPLGVLVSMYPTLADSARSGVQALAGLASGIALGFGALLMVAVGAPGIVAVAAVVAASVALGGIRSLGAGREWIAIAGVLVLLIGGHSDGFSVSYIVTMAFGILVGVAVNLIVFPPVFVQRASGRLSVLRDEVAARLADMADAVADGPLDADVLERAMDGLSVTVSAVAAEVHEGDTSRRGNPRARRHRDVHAENARRMRALERTAFFTRDLADVLMERSDEADPTVSGPARERLGEAIGRCGELVATPIGADEGAARLTAAKGALAEYLRTLDDRPGTPPSDVAESLTAAVCLRRIIDASRPFVHA